MSLSRWPIIVSVILFLRYAVCSVRATSLGIRQTPGVISTQNFARRGWHASAVAKNYLYIEGGEFSYTSDGEVTYQYSTTTLSINLSEDWRNDSVVPRTTNKPSGAPNLSSPAFAYDEKNDIFYSGFAGRVSSFGDHPDPPPLSLWSFKPDGTGIGTWKREIDSDNSAFDDMTRPFRGYQAYSGDTALVLGGISNSQSDEKTQDVSDDIPLPGLLALNMTTKTFTNSTARSFNRGRSAVVGRMQYVPSFGPDGLFMAMGGSMIPVVTEGLISFGNIWVYQAETNTWFNQTARGNLPGPRKDFCLAGANSTNGTYEIFLYGGQNGNLGPEAVPYDEIYILTLPAFSWLKVDYPPEHPRHGHTCEHVGGSQIVSIGGLDSNSRVYYGDYSDIDKSTFNSSADPFAQGLGIFDMTTLTWADHYSANPPAYEQSELVRNFYSQNPQDGSQFTDAGLRDLFQVTHFNQETPAATTSSPTPELSSSSSSSSSNTGAIAGGVVGGIGGIALVAGAAFFLLRRKRGRYAKTTGSSTPDLQGNGHPLQEVDGNKPAGYHELSPQHLAEMEEARPEMGHDEAGGVYGRPPLEMEAREVGKGRGG